jgi:uncharacterized membrane protein
MDFVQRSYAQVRPEDWISNSALLRLRQDFVEDALVSELGEVKELERAVIDSLKQHEILSQNPDEFESEKNRTLGQKLADEIAYYGGSWRFILSFTVFVCVWIIINVLGSRHPADPYPFILLNLILSCLAALQAPIIMMSQNRQEQRDRERAIHDYQIDLKAELEIRALHEKIDHLLQHHGARLLEIQMIQTQLLEQLIKEREAAQDVTPA